MPKSIHVDHHDTAHELSYVTSNRSLHEVGHEREVYKSLVSRLFHEGRVIEPTYLDDQPNLRPHFRGYWINGTIAIAFIINNFEITLTLEEFARILRVPCQGVCVYTPDWPISSLQYVADPYPNSYPPPHEDPSLIRDALFYERTQAKTQKMKGVNTILDPFQMIKRVYRFKDKGIKAVSSPTPTPPDSDSSDSPSPTPHQNVENDPVDNYTLDPIPYMNQLSPIEGGESPEFKQTKGMFKCIFHYLCKKK
ncbi:hypothetical protein Tco_1030900 [Tanacetum coccineum]|uniref:Uncharacterized protein n=1 Tax=Tanacetum coccineum TaxID=301880 RepID=A0ABQ5G975_9ASTR